ncbi:Dipeptidyl peptidase 2 like protein [Argiope bruennichi]|uniref:Dipeptidyl peptidase 2 like protein n=1 Tax=Argiope bruennichi TaxID=94029 RepID=A0A8T0FN59_ARGBR|nr:Dipeptidyl peptidase 2 like protein [Argiope bruennichi]
MYILYTLTLCLILIGQSYAEDYDYYEGYFDQKIDHFNFLSHGNQTYKQRYLFNATWWDVGRGPIFFYAGNEGDVVGFWKNTGFIFKAAKQFNAFRKGNNVEKTKLLKADSNAIIQKYKTFKKLVDLTKFKSARRILVFVPLNLKVFPKVFKRFYKEKIKHIHFRFGGSYGGMLAAYMRFKYPNIIHGAIAASAPLYQVAGKVPGDVFFQAVTKDFHDISPDCEAQVRSAFSQVDKWAAMGQAGYEEIARTFRLCKPLNSAQDYQHLLRWARNAFVSAAMMDYPYAASFMGNFPAFPR